MDYIRVTKDNLDKEHICCAISNNNNPQVSSKKTWLRERMEEGLVFLKAAERGKCFIEYLPAEFAWAPIKADGYMFINCFWVSGSFKGNGYSNDLLNECIGDSKRKGKKGLCVISSKKKKPFLSDPKYLVYKGFKLADTAEYEYELLYLPFGENTEKPQFLPQARTFHNERTGFVLYYTAQCPYNAKYVPILENIAKEKGIPFVAIQITTRQQAQSLPCAVTTFALFRDGKYLGNEILSEKKFVTICN